MLRASLVLGLLAPLSALAPAPKGGSSTSRRSALTSTLAALSTATLIQPSVRAVAAEAAAAASAAPAAESPIDVYFGCGCFWHVQHEFVEAERRILSRDDLALTSYAGYAGGKAGAKDGKVPFLGEKSEMQKRSCQKQLSKTHVFCHHRNEHTCTTNQRPGRTSPSIG